MRRIAAVISVCLVVAGAGLAAETTASASQPSASRMVPGYLSNLHLATLLAPAPASRVMRIGVGVQRPNAAGELALYEGMYDPTSPDYHHFLTPAQFNQRFGVPPAVRAAVQKWLTAGGLSIDTSTGGDYFTATGTVAQLDKLFRVRIGSYVYRGERFLANDAPPSVPSDLPIDGVAGLDTVHKFTLDDLHGRKASLAAPTTKATSPEAGARAIQSVGATRAAGPQSGTQIEFTPQELWGIYNDPGATQLTNSQGTSSPSALERSKVSLGQGQIMGIFGEGETSSVVGQLRLFETAMGFPKVPTRTIDTEGPPDSGYGDNTGSIEWYLDSQASTGMAPDVSRLDFYFAKTLFDADIFQDFKAWANDPNGPRQMNASFGECEANPTNPVTGPLAQQPYGTEFGDELEAMAEPILRQATMEGRTLFSSSGDTGSGCPEIVVPVAGAGNGIAVQPVPAVGYPCDSSYVVCVGGTVVSAEGDTYPAASKRVAETSWTNGGGGTSYYIQRPSFQKDVANVNHDCVSTPSGTLYPPGAQPCRGVPDVADLSGNIVGDGYFIYIDGEPSSEGGTSLSSPLMMGQWSRIQAAAPSAVQKRGGVGYANPTIYKQAASADTCSAAPCTGTYARDFYDVTDSELGAGNGAYQPGPGWDYASGWGALNVASFMQDVDGTTNAGAKAASPERAARDETKATMTSPSGNATNPVDVSAGNVSSLDLTSATLTAPTPKTITATLTGPDLTSPPSPAATGGNIYYVTWEYKGVVYYAKALEDQSGSFTYTSGDTGTYGKSATYGYNDTASSAATGSVNQSTGTITINVPASEVGSPPIGARLTVPQAFDQISESSLGLTTDSSDDLTPVSKDAGASVSRGVDVVVGGAKGSPSGGSKRGGSRAVACRTTRRPTTRVRSKRVTRHEALALAGIASTSGCGPVGSVGVAVAEVVGHKCRFMDARGHFSSPTSCRPRRWIRARGAKKWTFTTKANLPNGTFHVWVRAVNRYGLAGKIGKFVALRVV